MNARANESALALDLWFKGQHKSAQTLLRVAVKNEFSLSGAYDTWLKHMLCARLDPELAFFLLDLNVDLSFLVHPKYGTSLLEHVPFCTAWCQKHPMSVLQLIDQGICYQGPDRFDAQFEHLIECAPVSQRAVYMTLMEREAMGQFAYAQRLDAFLRALEANPAGPILDAFKLQPVFWIKGSHIGLLQECQDQGLDANSIEQVKRRLVFSRWMKII